MAHFYVIKHRYILSDLSISGIELQSEKRQRLLTSILNGYGVKRDGDALVARAKISSFPQKKHALLQAMLTVNDMFLTARSTVSSLFLEDVQAFFQANEIRHVSSIQLVGQSGFPHRFSFVIPAGKQQPERLVEPVNVPDRNRIEPLLFSWSDTREMRQPDTVLYACLNDTEKPVSGAVINALEEYEVRPLLWSRREEYVAELSA